MGSAKSREISKFFHKYMVYWDTGLFMSFFPWKQARVTEKGKQEYAGNNSD